MQRTTGEGATSESVQEPPTPTPSPPSGLTTSNWLGLFLAVTLFAAAAAALVRPPRRRGDQAA